MPAALEFDRYLDVFEGSARRMAVAVEAAGLDAPVITCPTWDGRALLAHQTMVHRWAAAHVTGGDPEAVPNQTTIRDSADDISGYFGEGLELLLTALRQAPQGLQALVFLNDAPPPRIFWARRQAHENTIHMVDALSASGRVPSAIESGIDLDVALDGLDELLSGFFTRGRSKLFDGTEFDVLVAPSDADRRWRLHAAETMTVDDEAAQPADISLSGGAVALYLALWNRGDEVVTSGDDGFIDRWRSSQRVRWS
jgi:uncharacterized protein (TIGR03083 family)